MADYDHRIENWKTSSLRVEHQITLMDTEDEIFWIKYDPTDKYIAWGWGDGAIRIFNVTTGKLAFLFSNPKKNEEVLMPITWLRWRPSSSEMKTKNILVAWAADGSVYHWHMGSGKLLHTIDPADGMQYYCLDYSPDGRYFALGGKDYSIKIVDEHTKSFIDWLSGVADSPGHSNRIFSVKFNQEDPNFLVSGGWDNTVLLWDLRVSKWIGSVYGPHICGDSIDIRDGYILAGSYHNEDNLYLIDMK